MAPIMSRQDKLKGRGDVVGGGLRMRLLFTLAYSAGVAGRASAAKVDTAFVHLPHDVQTLKAIMSISRATNPRWDGREGGHLRRCHPI